MAKLTNDMRNTFINRVMADVPSVDYETKIRDAVNKAAVKALPKQVQALYANESTRRFVNTVRTYVGRQESIPESMSFCDLPAGSEDELRELATGIANQFGPAWAAQKQIQNDLRTKLRSVAYHCTTVKALADAFPEFARYLPKDEIEATRNLPALANVVTDFMKAGWPKDKKRANKDPQPC